MTALSAFSALNEATPFTTSLSIVETAGSVLTVPRAVPIASLFALISEWRYLKRTVNVSAASPSIVT